VERKKQSKRKDDVSPEQGSDLYKETEITKTFEHDEFLEEVLRQKQSPKSQGNRIAIIGEPGAGKTTLLQHIADWVSSNIEQSIVIWVSLADLEGKELKSYLFEDWLNNIAETQNRFEASKELKEDFIYQFNQGRVWLLLDGLDEMSVSSSNPLTEIERQIRKGGSISQARIVLTCRVNLWDGSSNQLGDLDIYRTLDFSYPDQVETFIVRWFSAIPEEGRERGQSLCTALKETGKKRIQNLVKNPLRLTLLCLNWQLRKGKLPDTKAEFYQQYIGEFYQWKQDKLDIKLNKIERLNIKLAELAKEAIDKEDICFRLQHKLVSRFLGEENHKESLLNLALNLGWLNNIGITLDRKPIYAFYHATFQEYFAALAIKEWHFFLNHFPDNPNHCNASYRIFEPQWKEVILLWLGRKDISKEDKEEFIEALVNFKDNCGKWAKIDIANRGFYEFQAYFLAAQGIAEFNDCSLIDEIVQQIFRYSFGYLNTKIQAQGGSLIDKIVQQIANCRFGYLNTKTQAQPESFLDEIRYEALDILPTTNTTIEGLIAVLRDKYVYNHIRILAAESLGKIDPGNQIAIEGLIAVLHDKNASSEIRILAAESLGKIDPGNQTAIEGLIAVLRAHQLPIYTNMLLATKSLGEIAVGNQTAVESLIAVLSDKNVYIDTRIWAASSLGKIDPGNQTAIEGLIAVIRTEKVSIDTCNLATKSLGEIGVGNQTAIEGLIAVIRDKNVLIHTRHLATESLGEIGVGNQTAIEGLIAVIRTEYVNSDMRRLAAKSLREIGVGNQTAIEGLIAVIRDNDVFIDTRTLAAESLGKIDPGNQTAIEGLIAVIRHKDIFSDTRVWAAESLGKIDPGNQIAIEGLIAVIRDKYKTSPKKNLKGLYSQGRYLISGDVYRESYMRRRVSEMEGLFAWIENKYVFNDTRVRAAESLGKIDPGNQIAIEGLIALIRRKDVFIDTRIRAVESLGNIVVETHMVCVVSLLKNCLSYETYKYEFDLFNVCYPIIWGCAKKMTYPKFYEAWFKSIR